LKVSVVGGREAGVGVGGFTLGGGISYFSGRYGWGCDNVRSYEVVLASGNLVTASLSSNPDLYWALRGGAGTNFGVVSKFNLAAFEQGNLWGGGRYYLLASNVSLAKAFENFNNVAHTDDFAHLYIAFVYAEALGGYIGVSGPVYGKPTPNPPIFDELGAITPIFDATSVANISTLSVELNQTAYLREV
jgi:FAD/FMN-containing dehydrogenase